MSDDRTTAQDAGDRGTGTPPPPREAAFFSGIRALGIVRDEGWLAGVCAGIARRIGVDPLIVRGAFVIVGLWGVPVLWVYALAWALLPDRRGHIAARGGGESAEALLGVAILCALGALVSWGSAFVVGDVFAVAGPGSVVWRVSESLGALALVAAVAAVVIGLIARRRRDTGGAASSWQALALAAAGLVVLLAAWVVLGAQPGALLLGIASLTIAVPLVFLVRRRRRTAQDFPSSGGGTEEPGAAPHPGGTAVGTAVPPTSTDGDVRHTAADDDYSAWRRGQEQWRADADAWRARSADGEQLVHDTARARAEAFRAESARWRAARRRARPRISLGFAVVTLGLAMIAAAASALWREATPTAFSDDERIVMTAVVALAVAGGVCAIAMIVAGIRRRRSGFLAFFAVAGIATAVVILLIAPATLRLTAAGASSPSGTTAVLVTSAPDGHDLHPSTPWEARA